MDTAAKLAMFFGVQIFEYGVPFLLALCILEVLIASRLRWLGVFGFNVVVAFGIILLDLSWIQSEMSKPGWDGLPDLDIVFLIGVTTRVILFNSLLTLIGWYTIKRQRARQAA